MLGNHAVGEVLRLTAAIKQETNSRARDLLHKASVHGWPVLYTYMSDGWGCKVSTGRAVHVGQHLVRREGKVRAEFLLERSMFKTMSPDGPVQTSLRWEQPRGFAAGKSGWHIFQAAVEHETVLRGLGLGGVVMTFLLQDGLHISGLLRRLQARQELYYDSSENAGVAGDPEHPDRLTDWFFSMRCIAHVASSSISWEAAGFSAKDLLDEVHIGIASCRNSSNELFQVVCEFVSSRTLFQDSADPPHLREEFWSCIGVRAEILPEVMRVDPRWGSHSARLLVSQGMQNEDDWQGMVVSVVMYFMRFQSFSETRWAGVGPSCRLMLSAHSVGLPQIVKLVYSRAGLTTYHLGGYKTLGKRHFRYMAIAALATVPCESFNLEIMQDDRFLKRSAELRGLLHERARWVEGLAIQTWNSLAKLICEDETGAHLRDMTLRGMHRMSAYLSQHGFEQLQSFPLRLTQGVVKERLAELSSTDLECLDPVSKRIRTCLRTGFVPEGILVRSLELLRESPCSTCLVEKAHGAGSIVRNCHACLSPTMLCHWALLAQGRVEGRAPRRED